MHYAWKRKVPLMYQYYIYIYKGKVTQKECYNEKKKITRKGEVYGRMVILPINCKWFWLEIIREVQMGISL